jgi:plasmid replication initiation protein
VVTLADFAERLFTCLSVRDTKVITLVTVLDTFGMEDLSSLLNSARDLTSHVARPDRLPAISLSLEQIEAQSRRLVSRQQAAPTDTGKGCVFANSDENSRT